MPTPALRRVWLGLLPAALLAASLPALGATVTVHLRDQNGVPLGIGIEDIPVDGGLYLLDIGPRYLVISITNLGADDCPAGSQIPPGTPCKAGESTRWQVTT
jgi:hypothetical protein